MDIFWNHTLENKISIQDLINLKHYKLSIPLWNLYQVSERFNLRQQLRTTGSLFGHFVT